MKLSMMTIIGIEGLRSVLHDLKPRARLWLLALSCSFLGIHPQPARSAAASPVISESEKDGQDPFRSIFISDKAFGRDPFFPNSSRRKFDPVPMHNAPTNWVPVSVDSGFDQFALRGVSHSANGRLALVNYSSMAEGEEKEFKVANQVVKVRCVSIRDRSVVISIKGHTKELFLREGL
jgi:hypothetical protein